MIYATPAQLLMGRRLHLRIPSMRQNFKPEKQSSKDLQIKQIQKAQKKYHDRKHTTPHQPLTIGDKVYYKTYSDTWEKGIITQCKGPTGREYIVQNETGNILKRNRIH